MTTEPEGFIGQCVSVASDVLRKPQRPTQTIELEDDILLRKDGSKVVGMTILNASARVAKKN
jgi:uncharacterized protein YuzE